MPAPCHPRLIVTCLILAFGSAAVPAIAAPKAAIVQNQNQDKVNPAFDRWAEKFAEERMLTEPESATIYQYFDGTRQQEIDGKTASMTRAALAKREAAARAGLARVERFLAGPLSESQRVSAQVLRFGLQKTIAAMPYVDHNFMFSQMSGPHVQAVKMMTVLHPLRRASDVDTYLSRLANMGPLMDQALVRSRDAASRKLLPPRYILERAQAQVDAFLASAPAQNVLLQSFTQRLAAIPDMTPAARDAAVAKATVIVSRDVIPAYGRIKAFLAEIKPATADEGGLSRLPNGTAAYRQALYGFLGKDMSPDEIHAIGLREVARIEGLMDRHLRTLGFNEGGIKERMAALDRSLQPTGEGDPRAALLARYTEIMRDGEKRAAPLFLRTPRAKVEVRREPPLTEVTAAASYMVAAKDGSRPGVFSVPLPGPNFEMTKMRSLSYHEAVPGHHFQLGIQGELTDLPKYRAYRVFDGGNAYIEGWALYAERLAVENNWYEGDIPGLLGALNAELFRARRLVVDTGLHAKGWTRQQGIDYGISAQEVERYIVWPGQACSYMIGMLHILDLREKARTALGSKFNLPEFHDVVLRTGSVPLEVLTQVVDRWTVAQVGTVQ